MTGRVRPEHDDPGEATGGLELVISRVLRLGVAASLVIMR